MTFLNRFIELVENPWLTIERYFLPLVIIERYLLSFRMLALYELDLDKSPRMKATSYIAVRQAHSGDLAKLVKMRSSEERWGEHRINKSKYETLVQERLESGHQSFIAEKAGKILGYIWIAFLEFYASEMERKIILRDDEAILYDVYTSSPYRGKGIFSRISESAFDSLRKNRYKKIYFITRTYNKPMIDAAKKLNAKMIEALVFIRILKFTKLMRTSLRQFEERGSR